MSPVADASALWSRLGAATQRGIHVVLEGEPEPRFLSYAALASMAPRAATALAALGIRRGDCVLVSAETTPTLLQIWLGLVWLGATPVPLPPRHALAGQAQFEARIGPILPHFAHYLHNTGEARVVREVAQRCAPGLRLTELAALAEAIPFEPLPTLCEPAPLLPEDIAFVQYTSGSTSLPKGIRVTYANLRANVQAIRDRLTIDPRNDCIVSWLPLYHDMGLIGKLLLSVFTTTPLVLMPPHMFVRRPLYLLQLIERHRGSLCSMPNFAYEMLLKRLQTADSVPDVSSMKWFGVGAEPVRPRTLAAFEQAMRPSGLRQGTISPCYGLAEATLAVSVEAPLAGYRIESVDGQPCVTCGSLVDGFEFKYAPSGALMIRGPSVARTALVGGKVVDLVDADGYYDTKDVALCLDGRMVILGRTDEMFVINGENRFPYDIEEIVREVCGAGTRAACIQFASSRGPSQAQVAVVYERRPQQAGDDEQRNQRIRQAVLARAGLQLGPVLAVSLKTIPVTPSGKIQRVRLKAEFTRIAQEQCSLGGVEAAIA